MKNHLFAIIIGVLAALAAACSTATAQALSEAVAVPDPLVAVAQSAAIVIGAVLFARKTPYLRRLFAPSPATEASKAACMALAVAAGLVCGWLGLAGGVTLAERLGAGFLAACAATFGRDFAVRSWRAPKKARPDAPEVTPGPFGDAS